MKKRGKAQVVRARVRRGREEAYLAAWAEWSGTLLPMGIETRLLRSEEEPRRYVELTWFGEGTEAAVADDRLVRIEARLERACEERTGGRELFRVVRPGEE